MNNPLIDHLMKQAETLSKDEKLLLAEKLLTAARTQSATPTPLEPRQGEWFKGQIWIADDFDAPLAWVDDEQ